MSYRTILFCSFLCGVATASSAQEPSGRVDLDLMASIPGSQLVVGRVAFTETAAACPHEFGTLRFRSDGGIAHLMAFGFLLTADGRWGTTELDDETYRHRVATDTCRVDVDIGEQVRRDNVWTSVLLPRMRRPSLSAEERSEAERHYRDSLLDRPDPIPLTEFGRYVDARNARGTVGSLRQGVGGTIREGLGFDGAQPCFDAVGDYLIDQRGVAFQFVTNLPGELNRFLMERVDIDDGHSRIYLTRGDCRFELTISAAVLSGDQWVPRSIAPFIPVKSHLTIQRGP
jgi:hypothetical protein